MELFSDEVWMMDIRNTIKMIWTHRFLNKKFVVFDVSFRHRKGFSSLFLDLQLIHWFILNYITLHGKLYTRTGSVENSFACLVWSSRSLEWKLTLNYVHECFDNFKVFFVMIRVSSVNNNSYKWWQLTCIKSKWLNKWIFQVQSDEGDHRSKTCSLWIE